MAECELFHQKNQSQNRETRILKGDFLKFFKKICNHKNFQQSIQNNLGIYQKDREKLLKLYERIQFDQLRRIIEDLNFNISKEDLINLNTIIRSFLNTLFIRRFGSVENINQILIDLSEKYVKLGKRLVLIFEDITSMGIYKDQILQFIFDKGIGKCDVIVGVTTGFVRDNNLKKETYKDRTDGYFSLTSEDGKYTYFLETEEQNVISLTLKYMKAIKKKCEICKLKDDCFTIFGDYLFPFTRESLINIYKTLIEQNNPKRTPRLLLEKVQKKILYDKKFPFVNSFIKEIKGYFPSSIIEDFPEIVKLFNIYGEEIELENSRNLIYLCISEKLAPFFLIDIDRDVKQKLSLIEKDGNYCAPTKKTIFSIASGGKTVSGPNPIDLDKKRSAFNLWIYEGNPLPYSEDLRKSIINILSSKYNFLDYVETTQKAGIKYEYSGKVPLFIQDVDKKRQEDLLRLEIPRESNQNVLDLIFEYAINESPENFDDLTNINLKSRYFLINWIDKNKEKYNKIIEENIDKSLKGLDLGLIAIFGKSLIQNIFFSRSIIDFNSLMDNLNEKSFPEIHKYCPNDDCYLNTIMCLKCNTFSNPPLKVANLINLKKNVNKFEEFFNIIFGLGKDLLNYNYLSKCFEDYETNFNEFIKKFSNIDYAKINNHIKIVFNSGEPIKLSDYIGIIYNTYFQLKHELKRGNIEQHLKKNLNKLLKVNEYNDNLSIEDLKKKIQILEENFTESWKESWSKNLDLSECDFESFFQIIDENIELINNYEKKGDIDIFDLTKLINNIANQISKSKELKLLDSLEIIFSKIERHKRIIDNSTDQENFIELEEKKEQYLIQLKNIEEMLQKVE